MIKYLLLFSMAAGCSLLLTPLVQRFAAWARVFDWPSERKIHKKPVPLLGGVPIFLSFNLMVILGIVLHHVSLREPLVASWESFLVCQLIILGLGILDDIVRVQPGVKLLFQMLVGLLIVLLGFGLKVITNPFSGKIIELGVFAFPVTIFWVVLITNALNLVDGLDGLAGGTAIIACMTIFGISVYSQNAGIAFVSLILAGSILGFLRSNFYPAKIFLGDSGSLLLGFLLSVLSIRGSSKGATVVAVLAPTLALGLPIMETLLSMIRRVLRSIHLIDYPTRGGQVRAIFIRSFSIFKADKDHIHHRLIKLGFSQRKAVMTLYFVCIALSSVAFFSVAIQNLNHVALLGVIVIAIFVGIRSLRYQEFKILENGLLIPMINFPIINRTLFLVFYDLVAISLSSYLSFALVFRGFEGGTHVLFLKALPIFLLIKFLVFLAVGFYKITWAYVSLEETLSMLGAIFLSSLSVTLACLLFFSIDDFRGIIYFVTDFYLLLTFAGGIRLAFRILNDYYRRSSLSKGKRVLIYGAGSRGSTVLKELRKNGAHMFSPVGFIDDDPDKRGKNLHGCPILGPIEDIEEVSERDDISEIIISSQKIGKEKIKKLIDLSKARGINVRQFEFRFYEFP
jgi:UDP-GlcNAc:undecaprenyl-phosphate GlcNAc-1-phosphate transferase